MNNKIAMPGFHIKDFLPMVILLGVTFSISGCYTYRSYVPQDLKEVKLDMPVTINNISIEDNRAEISEEEDIKIPTISGMKRKAWKHHPKLIAEHEALIENTVRRNFSTTSLDTGSISIIINYACKEFEQTGMSEIERVYLDIETKLKTKTVEYYSSVKDTFHYQSIDASKKHLEKLYQTSIQNNLVRNISVLRSEYYNTAQKALECADSTHSKSINLSNVSIMVAGKNEISALEVIKEPNQTITQDWEFKIVTNNEGKITYLEVLNSDLPLDKKEEAKSLMLYVKSIRVKEAFPSSPPMNKCWKLTITMN
ncbi:MAG: hypothetical protein AAGA77_02735 [Bacteroidota bacterium]